MPDTAADYLAAIDTVAGLISLDAPTDRRVLAQLRTLRDRIELRASQDEAIGRAFLHGYGAMASDVPVLSPAEVGALIRSAVESTGATITDPPRTDECATAEEAGRG